MPAGVLDPSHFKTEADAAAYSRGSENLPRMLPTREQTATALDTVADVSSDIEAVAVVVTGVSAAFGQIEVAVPAAKVTQTAGQVTVAARLASAAISPSEERTKAAVTDAATMGAGQAANKISDDAEAIVILSSKTVEKLTEP